MGNFYRLLTFLSLLLHGSCAPERGVWDFSGLSKEENYVAAVKNTFAGTNVKIRVRCSKNSTEDVKVKIGYVLRKTPCWEEYFNIGETYYSLFYKTPGYYSLNESNSVTEYIKTEFEANCDDLIDIHPYNQKKIESKKEDEEIETLPQPLSYSSSISSFTNTAPMTSSSEQHNIKKRDTPNLNKPVYVIPKDGVYLLIVYVGSPAVSLHPYKASVHLEMRSSSPDGYLSITDYPLLPFYSVMCGVYVLLGLSWLIVCSLYWREILRLQFWIGGVILMGMVEKAMFTAEYQNIHNTGQATQSLILAAEVVSCAKRTIARILVIIVSLGYGIVKPRLGPTLHKAIFVGGVYFFLAVVEGFFRTIHPKNGNQALVAAVPLAVIDASVCWWVFSAIVATTRQLRLRRNLVKLSVYKHFANTLVFSIITSIIFMLWSIKTHKSVDCLTQWKDLWVDEAFWHLLFSVILCVIMVLWRPSKNNQRYAFTPLLDKEEDYTSDEEEDILYSDAWDGLKMRGARNSRPETPEGADPELDPLKWVEENIPDVEGALPMIDSEEEIETTKVEISKLM